MLKYQTEMGRNSLRKQRIVMNQVQRLNDAITWLPKYMINKCRICGEAEVVREYCQRYNLPENKNVALEAKAAYVIATGRAVDGFGQWEAEDVWTGIMIENNVKGY